MLHTEAATGNLAECLELLADGANPDLRNEASWEMSEA